jgi:hypothetical protein
MGMPEDKKRVKSKAVKPTKKISSAFGTALENKRVSTPKTLKEKPMRNTNRVGSALGMTHKHIQNVFAQNMKVLGDINQKFSYKDGKLRFRVEGKNVVINQSKPNQNNCLKLIRELGFTFNIRQIPVKEIMEDIVPNDVRFASPVIKRKLVKFGQPMCITMESCANWTNSQGVMIMIPDLFYEMDDAVMVAVISLVGVTYLKQKKNGNIDKKLQKELNAVSMVDFIELKKGNLFLQKGKEDILKIFDTLPDKQYTEIMNYVVECNDIGEA